MLPEPLREKASLLFWRKEAKDFISLSRAFLAAHAQEAKVFWFFLQKELLSS
jgi:hypothetical protein